ncbi:CAP domain-containing protein [Haloglomus litoreum]|uniref:CAP domain-containing protein n=1 Tax=Haloglomus litoreum TaxID=3034026 RepID=UPI0023E80444|nr:CAP domain-containing protein [Haloglomus sp. DT116]
MADCVVCGRETSVTAACPHCGRPVCAAHRPTDAHDCPGLDAERTGGWIIDLDGPAREPIREGGTTAGTAREDSTTAGTAREDPGWRELLTPSRSGAYMAAGSLLVVLVAALLVVFAAPGPGAAAGDGLNETRVEHLVAEEVNERRAANGLDPLDYDADLAAVAAFHSRDMHDRDYFAHEGPDGETVSDRYSRFGIDCNGGENIYLTRGGGLAATERTLADHVVREWMNSEGHREAILKERFTRQGIGIVIVDGSVYATQNFC